MFSKDWRQAFTGTFMMKCRPKNLAIILILLTVLSMSALLLRSEQFTDNYFDVYQKLKGKPAPGKAGPGSHPIQILVDQAHAHFNEVVARQSTTLDAASKEYEKRYRRKVPNGFEAWYAFAKLNGVTRIDEYDDLMRWFEPFRNVPAKTLTKFVGEAVHGPGVSKWTIRNHTIYSLADHKGELDTRNGTALVPGEESPSNAFWHVREFKHLLDPILESIPDMDILLNEWDEPRVLLGGEIKNKNEFEGFETKSYTNAYVDLVENPCKGYKSTLSKDAEFPLYPYLSNLTASKEVCQHPEVGKYYGMVASPNALSVTRSPVPLLSMSKISSVGDLTYPNVLYIEGLLNGEYDESKDQPWSSKDNDLYWTGRTSGGLANAKNDWHTYHRQRFVASVNGLVNTSLSSEFQKDKDLYKIRFPAVNQCDADQCEEMTEYFSIDGKPDPFTEIFKHKYLLDLDGNVYSRRYYSLMFSKSTVLKQTWQQEYFDEWLFPYVHYIPVSMDFEELPDMMRFLARTPAGQKISQDIADAGRVWALQNFRAVEGTSYLFRLLLEYAELFKAS